MISPNIPKQHSFTSSDQFTLLRVLDKGIFADIFLAETRPPSNSDSGPLSEPETESKDAFSPQTQDLQPIFYALKILPKARLIENNESRNASTEKSILIKAREANHPFIVRLISTFQTENHLYFVLDFATGGNLMEHIQREAFGLERARFYAAELCLALGFLHQNGIIHRNLKLNHLLLTAAGHIQLVDFGVAAQGIGDPYGTTKTFCGCMDFMAPEILRDASYGRAVDWWSFGTMLFQMILRYSPFQSDDEDKIYDAILDSNQPSYPANMPDSARDLIQKLMRRDPQQRLGYRKGVEEIMSHAFFESMDWEALFEKRILPPFKPLIKGKDDVSNFAAEFTSKTPSLPTVHEALTPTMQEYFKDFSSSNGE